MARRSRFEHLKPEVWAEFDRGLSPSEVTPKFPRVPKGTIYGWCDEYRRAAESIRNHSESAEKNSESITVSPTQVLPPPSKLVAIDGGDNASDFQLARRTLRAIARHPSQEGAAVGVQAAVALMKLIQLRADMPRHILEETEDVAIEDERSNLQNIPPSEVARRYREALG